MIDADIAVEYSPKMAVTDYFATANLPGDFNIVSMHDTRASILFQNIPN